VELRVVIMDKPANIEIDAVELVDDILRGFVQSSVPMSPAIIAETMTRVLCANGTSTERTKCFADLLILIRARIDLLDVTMKAPN
jgi:predicted thioredoxin/glutaredoxin